VLAHVDTSGISKEASLIPAVPLNSEQILLVKVPKVLKSLKTGAKLVNLDQKAVLKH